MVRYNQFDDRCNDSAKEYDMDDFTELNSNVTKELMVVLGKKISTAEDMAQINLKDTSTKIADNLINYIAGLDDLPTKYQLLVNLLTDDNLNHLGPKGLKSVFDKWPLDPDEMSHARSMLIQYITRFNNQEGIDTLLSLCNTILSDSETSTLLYAIIDYPIEYDLLIHNLVSRALEKESSAWAAADVAKKRKYIDCKELIMVAAKNAKDREIKARLNKIATNI